MRSKVSSVCAEANRNRCMRCGKGSKYMKMQGRCDGPEFLSKRSGKWGSRHLGGHDLVRRMDRQGGVLKWCRQCSGFARHRKGPKLMNCCRPEPMGTQRVWQHGENNPSSRGRKSPSQRSKELENRGGKEKNLRERSVRGCLTNLKWKA